MAGRLTTSVAMATCEGAVYLREQLDGLVSQRRQPDELVVSDDASTDDTIAILDAFVQSAPFPVVVLRNEVGAGVSGNFERAIRSCTSDVVFLSDQDDIWNAEKIELLAAALERDEAAGLVFCDLALVDVAGTPLGESQWQRLGFQGAVRNAFAHDPFRVLLRFNVVTGAALAFRASLLPMVLPIPPAWLPDEWVALLAAATSKLDLIDARLVAYRQHRSQEIGGAVSGWLAQFAYARQHMDASYMRRAAERSRIAAARLEEHRDQLLVIDAIDQLEARAGHYDRRAAWRTRGLSRVPAVLKEWAGLRYRAYDYGWKAAVFDLMFRDSDR